MYESQYQTYSHKAKRRFERTELRIPPNIVLADAHFNRPAKIDILIGAEAFFDLLSVGQIKLGPILQTAENTIWLDCVREI